MKHLLQDTAGLVAITAFVISLVVWCDTLATGL